jgi:hypothetical protein
MIKKVMIVINIIALPFSLRWCLKTEWDNHPVIVLLGLICTLVGLVFSETRLFRKNEIKITGNTNLTAQDVTLGEPGANGDAENRIKIKGDGNITLQSVKKSGNDGK